LTNTSHLHPSAAAAQPTQMAAKEALKLREASDRAADRAAAAAARLAAEAEAKLAKAAARRGKAALLAEQRAAVAGFKARKLAELNDPLLEADRWVHAAVIDGTRRGFLL
jgi:hypothetical protein